MREAVKLLSSKGLLRIGSGTGTWVLPTSEWNFLDPTVFRWVQDSDDSERAISLANASEDVSTVQAR